MLGGNGRGPSHAKRGAKVNDMANSMRYITTHPAGFTVRISYPDCVRRRFFSSIFPGRRVALDRAKKWVKQTLREFPNPKVYRMKRAASKNSKSNIRGVCRVSARRKAGRYVYYSWAALYRLNGKWRAKHFYVKTLGETAAKKAAISFRKKFESEYEGI